MVIVYDRFPFTGSVVLVGVVVPGLGMIPVSQSSQRCQRPAACARILSSNPRTAAGAYLTICGPELPSRSLGMSTRSFPAARPADFTHQQREPPPPPASDVLLSQPLYLHRMRACHLPNRLNSPRCWPRLAAAASRSGYTLRVALIAEPADLGSVTELSHQPQNHAHFLGQELSLNYNGPLLVLMPNGYGLYQPHASPNDHASVLSALAPPGRNLAPGALGAIERLAAASGHNLPTPAATTPTNSRSSDTTAWTVFGIGAIIIILA